MWHTLGLIVGFTMLLGGLGAFGVWAWHSTLPKRETLPSYRNVPEDIKVWQPRHRNPVTAEFSAVTAGENKHYSDITVEMDLSQLRPVPKP